MSDNRNAVVEQALSVLGKDEKGAYVISGDGRELLSRALKACPDAALSATTRELAVFGLYLGTKGHLEAQRGVLLAAMSAVPRLMTLGESGAETASSVTQALRQRCVTMPLTPGMGLPAGG